MVSSRGPRDATTRPDGARSSPSGGTIFSTPGTMKPTCGIAASALLFGLAAGCGGDATGAEEALSPGTFEAALSGDAVAEFRGRAVAVVGVDPAVGDTIWVLALDDDAGDETVEVTITRVSSRPPPGSYPFSDLVSDTAGPGWLAAILIGNTGETGVHMGSTGGTLEITVSTATELRGSFTLQLAGTLAGGGASSEGTGTLTGRFDASEAGSAP